MRYYNQWAGNPKGDKEDNKRCIAEVRDSWGWLSYQCKNKRGKGKDGLYCGIHARKIEKGGYIYTPDDKKESI